MEKQSGQSVIYTAGNSSRALARTYQSYTESMTYTLTRHRRNLSFVKSLAILIILLGTVLRVRQFATDRSLWLDEAMLALSIVDRSFFELAGSLEYDQGAPIGFLVIQKVVVTLLGNSDLILRLFPLIVGIAALFLMYRIISAFFEGTGLIALGLFAVSGRLIYYASEAKQYSSDVAVFLLLLVLAHDCLRADADLKHFLLLGLASILSLWMSHPALFVVIGISTSLALEQFLKKDWQKLRWVGGIVLAQGINFIILYFVSLRSLAANKSMLDYWSGSFMPIPPWHDLPWFPNSFFAVLHDPAGLRFMSLCTVVLFIGYVSLFFRRWQLALCLSVSFLVTLVASGFEKYPMRGRLLLFIVPAVYLLVAEGVNRLHWSLSKINRWASLSTVSLLTGVLLYSPTTLAFQNFLHPSMEEHIKPVMSYVNQRRLNGDLIYVYYAAIPAFRYYAPFCGLEKNSFIAGIRSRREPDKYIQDIDRLRHHERIWFLFSHNCGAPLCTVNEEIYFLKHLDGMGRRMDQFRSLDASAYLYNMRIGG